MNYKYFIFLMAMFLVACEPASVDLSNYVEAVKKEYAPDKRVAIFNIEATQSGETVVVRGESNQPKAIAALLANLKAEGNVVDSIRRLPDMGGMNYGVVNLSVCNIRSKPKHSGELSTQATLGTVLNVYKKEGDWYWVQTPDQYLGWLDAKAFVLMDETQKNRWETGEKVIYQPDFGFSYDSKLLENPVSDLLRGNILGGIIGEEEGIVEVKYPDGRLAFVQVEEVMNYKKWKATRALNTDNILASARQYMGRPYLWGGTSGKGMDCSGFTKTVFHENGMMLPRDASQQVHVGKEIEVDSTLANLQKGDLLFFGRKATADQKEKIWHVAIYLGEGEIIHATGSVCVESLKRGEPHFAEERLKTLVRAKRLM